MTTFLYDDFGAVTNETVLGVAGTNTIERYYDSVGRSLGYALNGVRQSTLAYDPATGRLATMQAAGGETPFTWNYLAGSDLKSSLLYPNGLTASWTYGNRGELLEVDNALSDGSVSKYVYTYDAAGRRIGCDKSGSAFTTPDTYDYLYNARSELTNATATVDAAYRYGYDFDDIGNRNTSSERGTNVTYAANQLNQYTAVDDFTPVYDADGNQTVVKTATGIWNIVYNGENRPVRWTQGTNTILMTYDRMGRRVTKNDQRFVYDGYLQIANVHSTTTTSNYNYYIWDPSEPVATRPLVWLHQAPLFYTHDGNKNVSEVISFDGTLAAHYEYAPFGALTVSRGTSAAVNPWRFSSEYAEDETASVYYNYRHYEPVTGRWMGRDFAGVRGGCNFYAYCFNRPSKLCDRLGLYSSFVITTHQNITKYALESLINENSAPCLQDRDKRKYVLDILEKANAGMDGEPYNSDNYLYLHFNRMLNQTPEEAIAAYTNALNTLRNNINIAIQLQNCKLALAMLGQLTHMTQDYWGHGVSYGYEVNPRWIPTGDPNCPFVYDPGYPPDADIGNASGTPDNPSMKPSSYGGLACDSEHGATIWTREPGNRAPDGTGWLPPIAWDYSSGRLGLAVDYTKKDLRKFLGLWCEKCCDHMKDSPQSDGLYDRPSIPEVMNAMSGLAY